MDIEYTDHNLNKNIYYLVGEKLIDECEEIINYYNGGEVFYINPTLLCIIINDVPSKSKANKQKALMDMTNKLNSVTKCKTALKYKSEYIKEVQEIRIAYEAIQQLRMYHFFCQEAEVLTSEYINAIKKRVDLNAVDLLLDEINERFNYNTTDPKIPKLIKQLFLSIIKPSLSYELYYYCSTYIYGITRKFRNIENNRIVIENKLSNDLFYSTIEKKCYELINIVNLINSDPYSRNKISNPMILQALDLLRQNYQSNISIQSIAEQLNMNQSYLSQVFTNELGISPQQFLIKYRIEKAKKLITESNMNFYSIAFEVGYFDPKQFTKSFKKITGMTPTKYKKKFQQE